MTHTERALADYGSEYDHMFSTLSDGQLWDGMVAIERVYSDRCAEFDAAMERHSALTMGARPGTAQWDRLNEAWAEIRAAQAGAAEQGKMLSAVNREIRRRAETTAALNGLRAKLAGTDE